MAPPGLCAAAKEVPVRKIMTPLDPIVFRELQIIHQIIDDEIWLEGERRGCRVSADDPVVSENVYRVIMRIGAQLQALRQDAGPAAAGPEPVAALPAQHKAA